ncbi:hypothetical protein BUALT_Bualt14G0014600 [Buddleja alternifolia]|uniref:Uncharacterized protein n=1 Tax=Buddleja alternifolia TaxID=168488 RepID=A0AAV6WDY2_9LAMI|nr:hypothetical protein BUALT_Bualt14G0014600 [Buddleja alternifolia]
MLSVPSLDGQSASSSVPIRSPSLQSFSNFDGIRARIPGFANNFDILKFHSLVEKVDGPNLATDIVPFSEQNTSHDTPHDDGTPPISLRFANVIPSNELSKHRLPASDVSQISSSSSAAARLQIGIPANSKFSLDVCPILQNTYVSKTQSKGDKLKTKEDSGEWIKGLEDEDTSDIEKIQEDVDSTHEEDNHRTENIEVTVKNIKGAISTGDSIVLWKYPWYTLRVLDEVFPLGSKQLGLNAQSCLAEHLPRVRAGGEDRITWTRMAHGVFTSESAREFLQDKEEKKSCETSNRACEDSSGYSQTERFDSKSGVEKNLEDCLVK